MDKDYVTNEANKAFKELRHLFIRDSGELQSHTDMRCIWLAFELWQKRDKTVIEYCKLNDICLCDFAILTAMAWIDFIEKETEKRIKQN
jgi:hypothetical protein